MVIKRIRNFMLISVWGNLPLQQVLRKSYGDYFGTCNSENCLSAKLFLGAFLSLMQVCIFEISRKFLIFFYPY
jgi:hypothetical protein